VFIGVSGTPLYLNDIELIKSEYWSNLIKHDSPYIAKNNAISPF
jgi:hypothetical protein